MTKDTDKQAEYNFKKVLHEWVDKTGLIAELKNNKSYKLIVEFNIKDDQFCFTKSRIVSHGIEIPGFN